MMSNNSRFTFPRTLGGQHQITSQNSSDSKQTQNNERCIYIVQEYACPDHPSLNSPRILHRTPCLQAVLPIALQKDCENYGEVSRYDKNRGCMECKTLTVKHPEILKKMQELGMEQESIDHFEKVTSSFSASRRVMELVRAREEIEEMESVRRNEGDEEDAAETEREIVRPQPPTVEAENLQLDETLEENNTPLLFAESTELETPTPTPTPATVPAEKIPSDQVATLQSSGLLEQETLNQVKQPQAAEIRLPKTPPPSSPSTEKLTDNVHIQLDEDWGWDDEEPERVFGEVALAPSFTCQTGDEWIVVGSWEQ